MIKMPKDVELSEVPINAMPLIDDTDFKTIKTAIAYNQAGLLLYWNFVTSAGAYTQTRVIPTNTSPQSDYAWGNVGFGMYAIDIPASGGTSINNNTAGYGWFVGSATGVLPWAGPIIQFSTANIVDSMVNGTDLLDISVVQWNGTAVSTPATAGIPEVNIKNINNVAASSVTTINANVGTTQPVNYTGTGASALVKSDMVDIAGAAVSTSTAQIGVNAVNIGGTAQTGRDIGASVLLSSGTGTGQLDFTSGVVKANMTQILGTAVSTPATAGILDVNVKNIDNDAASASGTVTFPNATLASTTNITAGTITTVTNVTTVNGLAANTVTASALATDAVNEIVDQVWEETLTDHSGTSGSTAAALNAAGSAGDPWSTALPGAYGAGTAGKIVGDNINATISSRSSHSAADIWAVGTRLLTAGTNIVLAKGTGVTGFNDIAAGTAMTLTSGERNSVADALLDRTDGVESGLTVRNAHRLEVAAAAGKLSGAATTTVVIRNAVADSKNRITATVDADGNRSAITTDLT